MAVFEVLIKGRDTGATTAFKQVEGAAVKAEKKLVTLSNRMEKISQRTQKMANGMKKIALPVVGIGIASTKMALDFDRNMTRITTLVGIAADEVEGMKKKVLNLSLETGKSATEMSRGFEIVTSAGLRGNDALEALELSAKASAAGLGEITDIGRAVAGIMEAYGSETVSAARATDAITAAARAGNFETSQLAGSLGRVLPFAKQAGASIEETTASIALLTRTNGDAAQSVTQVAALMRAFATPTAQTSKALRDAGTSAEEMRERISRDGLVSALQFLDKALDGNKEKLGLLLGTSEGVIAALQILNADASTLDATFGEVAKSAGITEEAFDEYADSLSGKFSKSINAAKVSLLELGVAAGPQIESLANGISSLAESMSRMSDSQRSVVIGLGLWTVGLSVALVAISKVALAVSVLAKAFAAIKVAVLAAGIGLGVIAAAVTGLIAALVLLIATWDTVIDFYAKGWEAIFKQFDAAKIVISYSIKVIANSITGIFSRMWSSIRSMFSSGLEWINKAVGRIFDAVKRAKSAAANLPGVRHVREIAAAAGEATANVFHGGGIYRAPNPGGAGMALLRDGERIVTPEQDRSNTGGNTINVNQQGLFAGANIRIATREDARAIAEEIYSLTRSRMRAQGVYA